MENVLDDNPVCSVERACEILGGRWTFLVLRELVAGKTRFSEIRDALGIPPNVLSARLKTLTDAGVLERRSYQVLGQRNRDSYELTAAGNQLKIVLAALQQWGDEFRPRPSGPSALRRSVETDEPVRVTLLDAEDHELTPDELKFVPA
ncbi:helix-turn-helix domain-containing protein [Amycolatopsis rhabdoformis]|uniref:Helix-turn-helix domain-containing protein n=1 Tax=Amycolatopsis rhabdoformis TaxID=1448059 RepID=A0ABZ1HZA0_9PSEU|nr:helix-turn-helix domain-containing protein [Amycolatopsis rhabdoformis]WSE27174.1 helix-turn-helix domain-containing protein [Amycolatopsis rhabdoformis]